MAKYYIAAPGNLDAIYGSEDPVCLSLHAVEQLAEMWEMSTEDLLDEMDEATPEEIKEYGVAENAWD